MTSQQIALIQSSFQKVQPILGPAAMMFYDRLFELDPSLRRLFRTPREEQALKLGQALTVVVTSIDRPDQIRGAVEALGRRHVGYGGTSTTRPWVWRCYGHSNKDSVTPSLQRSATHGAPRTAGSHSRCSGQRLRARWTKRCRDRHWLAATGSPIGGHGRRAHGSSRDGSEPHPGILAVASGHLREAELSAALVVGLIGRYVALDADAESLREVVAQHHLPRGSRKLRVGAPDSDSSNFERPVTAAANS